MRFSTIVSLFGRWQVYIPSFIEERLCMLVKE